MVKLNKLRAGYCVGNSLINRILFADDLCCLSASLNGSQSIVDLSTEYALKNDLIFTSQKSFGVAFLSREFQLSGVPTLTFNHNQIRFVDYVKYLSINLSRPSRPTLNDDNDIARQIRYVYCYANMLKY